MRTKVSNAIIYTLTILLAINTAYGQEKTDAEPQKLDFLVSLQKSDLVTRDKTPVFNLRLELLSEDIGTPENIFVKIISEKPREIYFIRALDRKILSGRKDVKSWEKERAEKEKARAALRMEKNKTRKEKDKLWVGPRYERQEGRSLQAVEIKERKPALVFGPFSPGDYQVYVQVTDGKGIAYLDRHNITISPDAEESEKEDGNPVLNDSKN